MPARLRLLLIASWHHTTAELRASLREHGLEARVARVDSEPALRAALGRGRYHAALYVRGLPGLARDLVHATLLVHAPETPLVAIAQLSEAGLELARVLDP